MSARRPAPPESERRPSDHWIDDITRPQSELLDPPVDTGANKGLVQIDLRFGQRRLCACLLGRQQGGHADHRGLLGSVRGIERALPTRERPPASFSISRCGTMPGLRFCSSRLTSSSSLACCSVALGFLNLAFRLQNVGLRRQHRGIDFGDLALAVSSDASCLELSSLKITSPFLTGAL